MCLLKDMERWRRETPARPIGTFGQNHQVDFIKCFIPHPGGVVLRKIPPTSQVGSLGYHEISKTSASFLLPWTRFVRAIKGSPFSISSLFTFHHKTSDKRKRSLTRMIDGTDLFMPVHNRNVRLCVARLHNLARLTADHNYIAF